MPSEHFNPGQLIFKEGEKSHDAYYLVHGAVEISVTTPHGKQVLGKISPGEVFGEMGMIMDRPRSATATAMEATLVESITEADFESYFLQNPSRLHVYLATLFERIRKTDLLLQVSGQPTPAPPARSSSKEPVFRVRITALGADPKSGSTITKLPFRIGRSYFDTSVNALARNEFSIEDSAPYQLSRNHCEIDFDNGSFVLRDRGSKLGSFVNGEQISVDAGKISAMLKTGENEVIFGTHGSPHRFTITIEELK
ncbi:MAG: cyclic nucleotide-binding domain-containing protein [Verrucomicrobiaceae bacterium]|nr:cyclic nucleotide-binding domain-containing protein [Verrucomicrobiaceae bacterium]